VGDCCYTRERQLVHGLIRQLLAVRPPKRTAGRPEKGWRRLGSGGNAFIPLIGKAKLLQSVV
jgi:hypothetical protein